MDIVNNQIEEYTLQFTTPESDVLQQLIEKTESELEYANMISGRQIGQLLQMLIRVGNYQRVLEIGTFTGYSAISMADALPDSGEVVTIEMNERYREFSRPFFQLPAYRNKIRQLAGDALELMASLSERFDLIYVDADKVQYPDYYQKSLPLLNSGGVMAIDNTLWGGKVLSPDDPQSVAIHELNETIRQDRRVSSLMLPVRDGFMLVYKK